MKVFSFSCDVCGECVGAWDEGATPLDVVRCAASRCSCVMHRGCVHGADLFGPRARVVEDAVTDFLTKKRKRTDAASFYCRCVM